VTGRKNRSSLTPAFGLKFVFFRAELQHENIQLSKGQTEQMPNTQVHGAGYRSCSHFEETE
jgi:hypothetical protein